MAIEGTTHERIMDLLSDGKWHHSNQICQPWVGGRQGITRIHDLRKRGEKIEGRKSSTQSGNDYRVEMEQGALF